MEELQALVPHLTAAVIAIAVAFFRSTLANVPPTWRLRAFDALICGACCIALSIITKNHLTDYYMVGDSVAIAFCVGFLGAGKVSDIAIELAKKKLNFGEGKK